MRRLSQPDQAFKNRLMVLKYRSNVFCRSSYWGNWSRILTPLTTYPVIEFSLTPINDWDREVRPIVFRCHGTSLDKRDELSESLPDAIKCRMVENLGLELTNRMLETDWLPLLDIPTVRRGRYGGGGLPFEECKRAARTDAAGDA